MRHFNGRLSHYTLAFAAALMLFAMPAQAGFKFTPAGNGGVSPATPPTAQTQGFLPAPMPVTQDASPAINLLPAATSAPEAATRSGIVEGFANDVPLTVALRQILPRGTMYNVASDIDVSTPVSWKGGRAWQNVLEDMLGRVSLRPTYSGNSVMIERATADSGATPAITLREPASMQPMAPMASSMAPMPAMQQPTMGTLKPPAAAPAAPDYTVQPREVTSLDPEFTGGAPAALMQMNEPMEGPASLAPMNSSQNVLVPPDAPQIYDAPVAVTPYNETMPDVQPVVMPAGDPGAASAATAPVQWNATAGQTLHEVLSDWAQRANIELNWLSEYDYPIQASMTFNGTFEEAVRTLLAGFMNAAPAPVGRLHRNDQLGQLALIIEARGNLYND